MEKVAIPQLDNVVAPRFEAARNFLIATITDKRVSSTQNITCVGTEGYRRARLLQIHQAHVLICSGIKMSYRDMLTASGIAVIANISGSVDSVLEAYTLGDISLEETPSETIADVCKTPHQDLVAWAREFFEGAGYNVTSSPGEDAFLVDLVADILCPVCGRPVRVAICCGAHTYSPSTEIIEFHHITSSEYHARVYVRPASDTVVKRCREYGIELLEPKLESGYSPIREKNKLPILKGPVRDHARATLS